MKYVNKHGKESNKPKFGYRKVDDNGKSANRRARRKKK